MRNLAQDITLMGNVEKIDAGNKSFSLKCRSGDVVEVCVGPTTSYQVMRNLDGLSLDRVTRAGSGEIRV